MDGNILQHADFFPDPRINPSNNTLDSDFLHVFGSVRVRPSDSLKQFLYKSPVLGTACADRPHVHKFQNRLRKLGVTHCTNAGGFGSPFIPRHRSALFFVVRLVQKLEYSQIKLFKLAEFQLSITLVPKASRIMPKEQPPKLINVLDNLDILFHGLPLRTRGSGLVALISLHKVRNLLLFHCFRFRSDRTGRPGLRCRRWPAKRNF
mmetsp:Transcript_19200/g.44924  ORF Transcript_19200/g.44924 Transcript_19200/m.44924 type:complete len:206 (+) Transcript_19200:3122-3739(+)